MTKLEQGSALNAWRLFDMNVVIEWHRLSGARDRGAGVGCWVLGARGWVSGVGCRVSGVRRLCRNPCGKPPAFRSLSDIVAAMPLRRSLRSLKCNYGKPEAFRTVSGKAATP